jgi:uncharacterized protein
LGVAAGFFSALFGVGGAVVIAPFLILVERLPVKLAIGTTLAAILPTAIFGTAVFLKIGVINWTDALLIGFPAVAGTLLGTWLQRRVAAESLLLVFAAFNVAVAIKLILA